MFTKNYFNINSFHIVFILNTKSFNLTFGLISTSTYCYLYLIFRSIVLNQYDIFILSKKTNASKKTYDIHANLEVS